MGFSTCQDGAISETTHAGRFMSSPRSANHMDGFGDAVKEELHVQAWVKPTNQSSAGPQTAISMWQRNGLAFSSPTSWASIDIAEINTLLRGYSGGAFDSRYVYFAPFFDGVAYHGRVARYDTTKPFGDDNSWGFWDLALIDPDLVGCSFQLGCERPTSPQHTCCLRVSRLVILAQTTFKRIGWKCRRRGDPTSTEPHSASTVMCLAVPLSTEPHSVS